jgi:chromosome partitioning protein
MLPKMRLTDLANFLQRPLEELQHLLVERQITTLTSSSTKAQHSAYLTHAGSRALLTPLIPKIVNKTIAVHIIKGGTGKTSLTAALAVRANLYGLKVLAIDLDQQANLSHCLGINAQHLPVMIDMFTQHCPLEQVITRVLPGLDLLPSRFENAFLDEFLHSQQWPLDKLFYNCFASCKQHYDLILIDCPPNLGKAVSAVALSTDLVLIPTVLEHLTLSGLKTTCQSLQELTEVYHKTIPFKIVINKYLPRQALAKESLQFLQQHPVYQPHLLRSVIRHSQEFANSCARRQSIYDAISSNSAQQDIDALICELLELKAHTHHAYAENSQHILASVLG